ncbi:hypothetical protein BJY00DRAFT_313987 [Aspergillus carlsbadensis]|nr:hypothetical protein BJY00DRAFT_313987 [Aspergillus carlsbadensis]
MAQIITQTFIVGVDYGLTYTKVVFVDSELPDATDGLRPIRDWPEGENNDCVPSHVAYLGTARKWGFDIDSKFQMCAWTKLLLDQEAQPHDRQSDPLAAQDVYGIFNSPQGKRPVDIVTDFLTEAYQHVERHVARVSHPHLYAISLEFHLTCPTLWSQHARNTLEEAAKAAGFGQRDQDSLSVVTEAEAATFAVLARGQRDLTASHGDGLLVCDCGGGTVDMATVLVLEGPSRYYGRQIHAAKGAYCGSTDLDRNLHDLFATWFPDAFEEVAPSRKGPGSVFYDEIQELKSTFSATRNVYALSLPMAGLAPNSAHYDTNRRRIIVHRATLCQKVFDPVIDQLIGLISRELNLVSERTSDPTNISKIALVGGFSQCPYLRTRLWNSPLLRNMRVIYIDEPQLAAATGAVLQALQGPLDRTPEFGCSYGFQLCRPTKDTDPREATFLDRLTDHRMSRDMVSWPLVKGVSRRSVPATA